MLLLRNACQFKSGKIELKLLGEFQIEELLFGEAHRELRSFLEEICGTMVVPSDYVEVVVVKA